MSINQKEQVEVFRTLESSLQISNLRVFDFNYWPVIRFAINYHRKWGRPYIDQPLPEPKQAKAFYQRLCMNALRRSDRSVGKKLVYYADNLSKRFAALPPFSSGDREELIQIGQQLPVLPKTDIVMWRRRQSVKGKKAKVNAEAFLTSLYKLAGPQFDMRFVSRGSPELLASPIDVMLPDLNIASRRRLLKPDTASDLINRQRILSTVQLVNHQLSKLGTGIILSDFDILLRIGIVRSEIMVAKAWLAAMQPKVILMSSYGGSYYLCAAARQLGITTVDIQHGGMHRHHAMAANWFNVPKGGYELLPDYFWCWTEQSASYVQFEKEQHHKAIIGGNPVLSSMIDNLSEAHKSYLGELVQDDRCVVVVALQYGKDELVPQHILEAWASTKDRYLWVFRLHPTAHHRVAELSDLIGVSEDVLLAAAEVSLPYLLSITNALLTKSSTIVHESIAFDCAPAVWSDKGRAIFDDLVENGDVIEVLDSEAVVRFLRGVASEKKTSMNPKSSAITKSELCIDALRAVLQLPPRSQSAN